MATISASAPVPQATAIILSAFGSAEAEHAHLRNQLAQVYAASFPGHPLLWALASSRVRAATGALDLAGALAAAQAQGCRAAVVQHLLLIPGQMYAEAQESGGGPAGLRLQHAPPLLAQEEDLRWLAQAVASWQHQQYPSIAAVHGNTRNPQHNAVHLALAQEMQRWCPEVVLASLEGEPGTAPLMALRSRAQAAGGAHVIPLFLFPGGHVLEDLLGPEPDSWRSLLGVPCSHSPTLLQQPAVQERFCARTRAALTALAEAAERP